MSALTVDNTNLSSLVEATGALVQSKDALIQSFRREVERLRQDQSAQVCISHPMIIDFV